jgi:hypothetical protein
MLQGSVGQILVNDKLPPELRDYSRTLDKKGVEALFRELAAKHPERYKDVLQELMTLGADFAGTKGVSVSLKHLQQGPQTHALVNDLRTKNEADIADPALSDEERETRIVTRTSQAYKAIEAANMEDQGASGNPLHTQVISGGRGNPAQLNQITGAELLVADHRNKLMPVPIYHSYADGLTPAEYWASSYGTRRGVVAVKFATPKAGFLGKQAVLTAHRQVVNRDRPVKHRLPVGLPVKTEDPGNVGSVLARDAGDYKEGTALTPQILADLRKGGTDDILVHSPLTSADEDGGLDAWSAGVRDRGTMAKIGDQVGIPAAQAITEPLSQGALCLIEGTLVLMADGSEKAIELIGPGEYVMGSDTKGKLFPVEVLARYDNGLRDCQMYTFRRPGSHKDFWQVGSTSYHKVLGHTYYCGAGGATESEKVLPIGKLNKASGIVIPRGYVGTGKTYEFAKLLGVLLGDGCFTESVNGVNLSCADPAQVEHLNEYLSPYRFEFRLLGGQKIYYGLVDLDNTPQGRMVRDAATGRITGQVDTHRARLWLKGLGLYGKYAHDKAIPAEVWSWDQVSVADLVAGLFVTDGSVYVTAQGAPGITFGACSEKLVLELSRLLRFRFGLNPTKINVDKAGSKPSLNHDYHSFGLHKSSDVESFARQIPLFGVKAETIKAVVRATKTKRMDASWARLYGHHSLGLQRTYDLEVDHPAHLFVLASGLIVSNSEKHSAGGGKIGKKLGGFDFINKLLQGPEFFQEAAPLAPAEGTVTDVVEAPQGGKYVHIGDHKIYVGPQHDVIVKPGDRLQAGDDLADGVPHPADLVKYRGIGEARKVYLGLAQDAFKESGLKVQRRNLEPIVAGLLNFVKVTDPQGAGDHLVDDVVPYNRIAATYVPRDGSIQVTPHRARGHYLEEPALHYSVGTKVTPRVADDLESWGIPDVIVHPETPAFEPHWERMMTASMRDPDWKTRLGGFYIGKGLLDSIHHGGTSDSKSTSFFPALAEGVGFGEDLETTGMY